LRRGGQAKQDGAVPNATYSFAYAEHFKLIPMTETSTYATAVRTALPTTVRLQIVTTTAAPPDGDGWLHEIKHDGHRLIAIVSGRGQLKLISRNGHDRTPLFRGPFQELSAQGRAIVLDGEIAVPDERGVTHIDLLQDAFGAAATIV
jgi:bifunctional non-homologous end joining protein LigD